MNRPANWLDVTGSGLARIRDDFLLRDLRPSFVAHTSWGNISTNQFGMRDRDYTQAKPADTYRIAMLGASVTMGWGVADDETYDAVLEGMLNDGYSETTGLSYETLNFGSHNYKPLQVMVTMERAVDFEPDTVFVAAHRRETDRAIEHLVRVALEGVEIPYPYLRDLLAETGVGSDTSQTVATRSLMPHREDVLEWVYRRIVELSQENGIVPVLTLFDEAPGITDQRDMATTLAIAERAGFVVMDLRNLYDGYEPEDIILAEWDEHPNALGHRIIAEAMVEELIGIDPPIVPIR